MSGHRVAAAVSGGADSVALALWLHDAGMRTPDHVTLAGLIHVNHHLRGRESDRDAQFVRDLAARLGVPADVVDAPISPAGGRSPESAARTGRYRAFAAAARRLGATRVATAHTADDQAETVLLRLLRGAGSRGIAGIRARRGLYVRPLLACRRSDVRTWLGSQGEPFCEDSTNLDLSMARNRLRHELLPVIERIAPGGVAALARAAALAEDDEQVLQTLAAEATERVLLREDTAGMDLDRERLVSLPAAIARRVLRTLLERVAPSASWQAGHFEAILRLATRGPGGGALDLPAVRVERVSNQLRVRAGHARVVPPFSYTLPLPGEVLVAEAGVVVSAGFAPVSGRDESPTEDTAYSSMVSADVFPVTVRNRRPGDRVALSAGTRKVQDLMVDAKIPRSERDRVPLMIAADGRILGVVWEAGTAVRQTEADPAGMVILRVRKLENT